MKLTPWFYPERPVRSGVYQVQGQGGVEYWCYYTAEAGVWGLLSHSKDGAVAWRDKPSGRQYKRWRGVLK